MRGSIFQCDYWIVVRIHQYDSDGIIFYCTLRTGKVKVKNLYLTKPNYFLGTHSTHFIKFKDGKLFFKEGFGFEEIPEKEIKDYEVLEI